MSNTSKMSIIKKYSEDPVDMFGQILSRINAPLVTMNLATVDSEFGVLNRTVIYRGLTDGAITFVTLKDTRKYLYLKENPKVAITFLLSTPSPCEEVWQIRLIDAEAFELNAEQIAKLWAEETIYAKIRAHICECGKPIDHLLLQKRHDDLLKAYEDGQTKLEQTETYTAFKVIPQRWDFYMSEADCIADRVQYRKRDDSWDAFHVAA